MTGTLVALLDVAVVFGAVLGFGARQLRGLRRVERRAREARTKESRSGRRDGVLAAPS